MPPSPDNPSPDDAGETLEASPPPTPVRVGWVLTRGTHARMGRILEPLAIGLLDELVELVLICPSLEELGAIPAPPVEVVLYQPRRWWQPRRTALDPLLHTAFELELDLLHAMEAPVAPLTGLMARRVQVPYAVSGLSVADARRLQGLNEWAHLALAVSQPIQAALIEQHVMPADQIHLVRPGVYPVRHATCFERLDTAPAVLAGGRLDDAEAYEPVLHALAEIRRRGLGCVFFVMGSGRGERRLRLLAEKLQLTDVLTFVSGRADRQLDGVFKSADVYVTPVPLPWFDLPSLQAMAAGIPVVACDAAEDDFLREGVTCRRFPTGDAEALAETLEQTLTDRAATRALVETALAYLREHHSASGMVRRLAALYRQTAAGIA